MKMMTKKNLSRQCRHCPLRAATTGTLRCILATYGIIGVYGIPWMYCQVPTQKKNRRTRRKKKKTDITTENSSETDYNFEFNVEDNGQISLF